MVVRPPVEQWNRGELEEQYHKLFQNHLQLQNKHNDVNKKFTTLNTQFRRSLLDRRGKNEEKVDGERYAEMERENQLMNIKLRSLKHQLLTYTHPSARPMTTSMITGRSTSRFVVPSSIRRVPNAQNSYRETVTPNQARSVSFRVTESSLEEKATIIKLNRLLRDRNVTIGELEEEIEMMKQKLQRSTVELEDKSHRLSRAEEDIRERESARQLDSERYAEEKIPSSMMNSDEIELLKGENEVLKKANERLVKQSLIKEFDDGATEVIELQKKLVELEEKLRATEEQKVEIEEKYRESRHRYERYRRESREIVGKRREQTVREQEREKREERGKKRKMKSSQSDDVLMRLYHDVAGIIETHDVKTEEEILNVDGTPQQKIARWQLMYSELYDELEKVRNMLLVQHDINEKHRKEIILFESETVRIREEAEKRVRELRETVIEKQKRISLLEEEIRLIAYGKQRNIKSVQLMENAEKEGEVNGTELTFTINKVVLSPDYVSQNGSVFFLSIEFFDFELQTTPILHGASVESDFTLLYNVVVSRLFVHYLLTNGISLELYRPSGNGYQQTGIGSIPTQHMLSKKSAGVHRGVLKMLSTSGKEIVEVQYTLSVSADLTEALVSAKRQEIAQLHLPLEIKGGEEEEEFVPLTVTIHRVTGLNRLTKNISSFCIAYELLSFSPFSTPSIMSPSHVIPIDSTREWMLPRTKNLYALVQATDLAIYVVGRGSDGSETILCMICLPLSPLAMKQKLQGTFPLTTTRGELTEATIDISVFWKYSPSQFKEITREKEEQPIRKLELSERKIPLELEPSPQSPSVSSLSSSSSSHVSERKDIEEDGTVVSPQNSERSEYNGPPPLAPSWDSASSKASSKASSVSESSQDTVVLETPSVNLRNGQRERDDSDFDPDFDMPTLKPRRRESERDEEKSEEEERRSRGTSPPRTPSELLSERESEGTRESDDRDSSVEDRKDAIRSMLGDLPPIAKPRLSRSSLDMVPPNDSESTRTTRLHFTHPLHVSVPPSDVSTNESTPRKEPVELKEATGKSNLKERVEEEEIDTVVTDSWVSVHIDRLFVHEDSQLLNEKFDGIKVYLDWSFLDFPSEDCRITQTVPLPRDSTTPAVFDCTREFTMDQRRLHLLDQWMRLGNRLEFSLVTDQDEDSDELGTATIDILNMQKDEMTTISFYDIGNDHLADLDFSISYSDEVFKSLSIDEHSI